MIAVGMLRQVDQLDLNAWVDGLVKQHFVFGIQAKEQRFAFAPAAATRRTCDWTTTSPSSRRRSTSSRWPRPSCASPAGTSPYEPVVEDEPFIIFGAHPYDVAAISQMDAIFSSDNEDVHYLSRRRNATIVACDMQNASRNTFASCMGTAVVQEGFDILLTKDRRRLRGGRAHGEGRGR